MQGCGRTLFTCIIVGIGTHVVGGGGYPRWYEYGVFSAAVSFALLNGVDRP